MFDWARRLFGGRQQQTAVKEEGGLIHPYQKEPGPLGTPNVNEIIARPNAQAALDQAWQKQRETGVILSPPNRADGGGTEQGS